MYLKDIFPLVFTTGLLVNHLILLLVQSLFLSLLLGAIIAGFSLIYFFRQFSRNCRGTRFINKKYLYISVILIIVGLYYFSILSEPLHDWDARSIWFLHAKMIWSAKSLGITADWHHPSIFFSHVDYPKLVPALAAQLSFILGYWNEYAPKLSLFLIIIPALFWVLSFYAHKFSFLFLLFTFPFSLNAWLWNGYMDGYVALYSAVAMLLAGRYFSDGRLFDLMSSFSCLALISNIKNEGMLLASIGLISIVVTGIISGKFPEIRKKMSVAYRFVWCIIIAAPGFIWSTIYKFRWNLANDLQVGTSESSYRAIDRLMDGVTLPMILKKSVIHQNSAVILSTALFCVSMVILGALRKYIISWIPAGITSSTYYLGLVFIYLSTPHSVEAHLKFSIDRTMLAVTCCILAGTYFILKEIEDSNNVKGSYLNAGRRDNAGETKNTV